MASSRILGCLAVLLLVVVGAQHAVPGPSAAPQTPTAPRPPQPAPAAAQAASQPQRTAPLLGDQTDGSRARPVHRIPLRDPEGEVVRPTDRPLLPFSAVQTCGADCHDVATIRRGWHFNVTAAGAPGVRRGEPWILVDAETATQVPLTYHGSTGAFGPEQLGLTPWSFAKMFAARTPGGLNGEREARPDLQARWVVSGDLEPDCLACHDASPAYDHAEYGRQVALENFRWAVAGASGLAGVTGSAKEMPNTFDYLLPSVEDALRDRMPSIAYAPERFLPGAKVILDIVREVPDRRCYFCHTAVDARHTGQGRWNSDVDIHLARGMKCVDCHRNGLDHDMTRGYAVAGAPATVAASCRGCHLAGEADRIFARGRLGAPYPKHAGLPPIHLQKLSCTACHAGPRPGPSTRQIKTSLAHRLGGLNVNKAMGALPHVYDPVFVRQDDGVTTPNRLVWPAFWGVLAQGRVQPLALDRVKQVMSRAKIQLKRSPDGNWPALDERLIAQILGLLRKDVGAEGTPVYVAGGRMQTLDVGGRLSGEEHPSAQPYLWPLAHDVRPASESLGARSCQDCHDANAPIFFGQVTVDTPLPSGRGEFWRMYRFQKDLNTAYVADFARSFVYRPWMKGVVAAAVTLLVLLALAFALPALARLSAATWPGRWLRMLVNAAGLAACGVSVASAFPALMSGGSLTGYRLMIHAGAAPVLAASAALVALFWARRSSFGVEDWNRVRRPFGRASRHRASPYLVLLRKILFWLALAAAIGAIVSVALALFPLLASVRQPVLLRVHRYAAVSLAVTGLLFACCAFGAWVGDRVRRNTPEAAPEA